MHHINTTKQQQKKIFRTHFVPMVPTGPTRPLGGGGTNPTTQPCPPYFKKNLVGRGGAGLQDGLGQAVPLRGPEARGPVRLRRAAVEEGHLAVVEGRPCGAPAWADRGTWECGCLSVTCLGTYRPPAPWELISAKQIQQGRSESSTCPKEKFSGRTEGLHFPKKLAMEISKGSADFFHLALFWSKLFEQAKLEGTPTLYERLARDP